jgi:peptidoglycan/xylan/chitin deacetylase (PgdA/CDA1 family)
MISLFVVLLLLLGLGWVFYFEGFFTQQTGGSYRNITDMSSAYKADAEIAAALERMKTSQDRASLTVNPTGGQRQVALTFDGLTDRAVVQKILDLLEKHKAKATFFVDGMQTAEDPQTVVNIKNAGHKIENYSLVGLTKMETLSPDRLVKDFCRSQKIIKVTTDNTPNLLKCNDTKYTEQVLQAAKACGFKSVVKSDVFVTAKNMSSDQVASAFVGQIRPGSIVSVKLKPNVDLIVDEKGAIDLKPAIDKQPGLKKLPLKQDTGEKEIVLAVEKLLIALTQGKYTTVYVETYPVMQPAPSKTALGTLRNAIYFVWAQLGDLFAVRTAYAAEGGAAPEKEMKFIYTTEPALAYTFAGFSKEAVVYDVLNRLKRLGAKGTFFVMETEMRQYPKIVRRVVESGNEIGLAIRPKEGETAEQIRQRILSGRKLLQSQYGIKTNLVKQPGGAVSEAMIQAVSNAGGVLIGQSVTVVQGKHKDYTSSDLVADELFPKSMHALGRGQIVHFRMDYYTSNLLLGDLMETIKQRKIDTVAFSTFYDNPDDNAKNDSRYALKTVGAILANKRYTYRYPVDLQNVPVGLRNDGPVPEATQRGAVAKLYDKYIGNADVDDDDRMLGFSKMESRRLDKTGTVNTDDKVIFLTFDDWGTDASVNKLLYVLRKHSVPGEFFVLTRNVLNNPNLLRTIAMDGHEIGSHTDQHQPMAVRDPKTGKQYKSQKNKDEYIQELIAAYRKLRDITGDVSVNGKYSLTRNFRPPQLAISKMGLEAVLEAGHDFIINGSYSTEDYEAKDTAALVNKLKAGIYTENGAVRKGAILVMHMSDTSIYTAVALDILLTANAAKVDADPSKFVVGRLSDYLIEGYSQMGRKKNLRAF